MSALTAIKNTAPIDATRIVIVGTARKAQKTNAALPASEDTSKVSVADCEEGDEAEVDSVEVAIRCSN